MMENIYWHVPGRVLVSKHSSTYTLDDLKQSTLYTVEFMEAAGEHPAVHTIIDLTQRTSIDWGVLDVHRVLDAISKVIAHPLHGWLIVVDPNPQQVMHWLAQTAGQLFNARVRIVPSQEEALIFLRQIDTTLQQAV